MIDFIDIEIAKIEKELELLKDKFPSLFSEESKESKGVDIGEIEYDEELQ